MTDVSTVPVPADPTAGLFDNPTTEVGPPDFSKMKKAELAAFYAEKFETGEIEAAAGAQGILPDPPTDPEQFAKVKVAVMVAELKALFPDPEALDSPEVTGFDPNDVIHATVAEIQGIETEKQAIELVKSAQDVSEFNFFRIGGVLAEMQSRGWSGEYDDFYTFIDAEFGYKIRKSQILIGIYHKLVGCGATWDEAKTVGWGKLAVIATHLEPENYQDWFKKAEHATHAELAAVIKEANANGTTPDPSASSTPLKKLSFAIHADQEEVIKEALVKAKEIGNTEYDGPALEYVCADFLAGDAPVSKALKDLPDVTGAPDPESLAPAFAQIAKADPEDGMVGIMEIFCEAFPDAHVELFPDGKPELGDALGTLVEEHGSKAVLEAIEALSE